MAIILCSLLMASDLLQYSELVGTAIPCIHQLLCLCLHTDFSSVLHFGTSSVLAVEMDETNETIDSVSE